MAQTAKIGKLIPKRSGLSTAGSLAASGIDVTKADQLKVYPEALTLITDPSHPLFDERIHDPLDNDLVESIRELGVKNPISVRKNGIDAKGKIVLEVVAGIQRTRAALAVNEALKKDDRIKVRIELLHGDDAAMYEWKAAENAQRRAESIFTRAKKCEKLLNVYGRSKSRIAQLLRLGGPAQVDTHLEFLSLSPEAQEAFSLKQFPLASMAVIAAIPRQEQPEVVARVIELGARKAHEIPEAVDAVRRNKPFKAPVRKKLMSRNDMQAWADALPECEGRAVLLYILGHDGCLDPYPHLTDNSEE